MMLQFHFQCIYVAWLETHIENIGGKEIIGYEICEEETF